MAVYKVPQDVEAEDKLLGPLTFKQFIFLLIAAGATMFAWLLYSIQPVLSVLPVPIILIFGGLAVFRREDQPVERYLLSFFNYTLRPRTRVWSTEGHYDHLVITAPKKKAAPELKKNVTEVHGELEKLAQIVDTRGWALRRPDLVNPNVSAKNDDRLFIPEQETPPEGLAEEEQDIMDDANPEVVQLDTMLEQASAQQKQELLKKLQEEASKPKSEAEEAPHYDPYGASMSHQHRINPDGSSNIRPEEAPEPAAPAQTAPQPTINTQASSDIMNLSSELTVSQIANKVNREPDQKLQEGEEIQLR